MISRNNSRRSGSAGKYEHKGESGEPGHQSGYGGAINSGRGRRTDGFSNSGQE